MLKDGHSIPSRHRFANTYLIGSLVGVWIGFYLTYIIQVEKWLPFDDAFFIGVNSIVPIISTVFNIYWFACLKSYATHGDAYQANIMYG